MLDINALHCYKIYGLKIATTRPLLHLALITIPLESLDDIDVLVNLVGTPEPATALLELDFWGASQESCQEHGFYLWAAASPEGNYSRLRSHDSFGTVDFVINPTGDHVWGFWSSSELFQDAVSMLLGAVLGHVLRLQGRLCLHASVVAMAGGAIALIGASGTGKSTTAAALAACGFAVLSDDIAALSWQEDKAAAANPNDVWVQPGYPSLRLWGPSLQALKISTTGLPRVGSRLNKCFLQLNNVAIQSIAEDRLEHHISCAPHYQFVSEALRLREIYVLNPPEASSAVARIQPLDASTALYYLLTHVYGRDMLTISHRQEELRQLTMLLTAVPVKLLHRPNNLGQLDQICDLIVSDCDSNQVSSV